MQAFEFRCSVSMTPEQEWLQFWSFNNVAQDFLKQYPSHALKNQQVQVCFKIWNYSVFVVQTTEL